MSSSEQLEREAERTRSQINDTLAELRGRLTPGQIVEQALDYARDGQAGQFVRNLGRQAVDNPMPIALIAAGIGWLALGGNRNGSVIGHPVDETARNISHRTLHAEEQARARVAEAADRWRHGAGTGDKAQSLVEDDSSVWSYVPPYSSADWKQRPEETAESFSERTRRMANETAEAARKVSEDWQRRARAAGTEIGETAGGWAEQAQYAVEDWAQRAGETAEQWAHRTQAMASEVSHGARHAAASLGRGVGAAGSTIGRGARGAANALGRSASSVGRQAGGAASYLRDHPLILAGLGIALGAAIGAAIPQTETEDEWMGEQSDALKAQASAAVQEQWEKGKQVAETAWEEGKHEAERQGLMEPLGTDQPSLIPEVEQPASLAGTSQRPAE